MFNTDIPIMLSMITGKEMNKCARDMHFNTYKPNDILWDIRQTVDPDQTPPNFVLYCLLADCSIKFDEI